MKRHLILILLAVMVMVLAAQCGLAPTQDPAASGDGSGAQVKVMDPWARPSPLSTGNGAVYLKLVNKSNNDEALLSVTSDVAGVVELHETKMGANDTMQMSPVARIEIPAGESVSLEPGGKHIMLMGLKQALMPGQKIQLTLNFEHSGAMTVEAEVHEQGTMEGMEHGQ